MSQRKHKKRKRKQHRIPAPVQGMMATMPEVQTALNLFYTSYKSFGELMFSLKLDAYESKHDISAYSVYRWVGLMASNIRNTIGVFRGGHKEPPPWDVGVTDEDREILYEEDDTNDMLNKVSKYESGVISGEKNFKDHIETVNVAIKSFGDLINIYDGNRKETPADIHLLNMLISIDQLIDAMKWADMDKSGKYFERVDDIDTS